MKRKIFYSILILVLVLLPLYTPSPAVAKSEPQVLNFVGYACNQSMEVSVEPIEGGYIVHAWNIRNEVVIFLITDKGRELYSIATKFLYVDATYDLGWKLISNTGAGYQVLTLTKGNGGWEGYSEIKYPWPGRSDNLTEFGVLSGFGTQKGRVMALESFGGFSGEKPTDGDEVCEGHGTYLDVGMSRGTITEKKDK